ncbi:hypothetical protein L3Q82_015454 [Scortum barcoo]|uniref:Uncharacterized protein n=1 Tax=Scortum barcoo TaxID=214431 RepID=A0ACB8VQ89_9TELE|nr:hypothetical protein L3Q82_015454 [Scortum barcoo]
MRKELEFLGHRVGGEGISTLEEKVQAVTVRDWPTPTNLRELKSFIGLASYYRRFVRGFSCIAAPLFRLQQKDSDFSWTPEFEQAFSSLKKVLTESPILTPPDPNLPFVLDTDTASDVGMGAVLSQVGPKGEKVVAYFKTRRADCTLAGRTGVVCLQGGLQGWSPPCHANADTMSRRPCAPDGCRYCEKREAHEKELCVGEGRGPTHDGDGPACREAQVIVSPEWRTQQEQDADLKPVLRWVESGQKPQWNEVAGCSPATKGLFEKFGALRVKDGVLQRAWKEPATGVADRGPQGTERDSVKSLSWNCWGRTLWSLKKSSSTPQCKDSIGVGQLRRDVEDFCRRCDLCTAHKGQKVPRPVSRPASAAASGSPNGEGGSRYDGPIPSHR